jgi:NADH-quinone oxidoreductase subunit K
VFVFFVIVVAAAEAAVGLAIVLLIARNRRSLNIEDVDELKS